MYVGMINSVGTAAPTLPVTSSSVLRTDVLMASVFKENIVVLYPSKDI